MNLNIVALTLVSSLACACAATPAPTKMAVDPADYQPPTDMEFSLKGNDYHRIPTTPLPTETPEQEAQRYYTSVSEINRQIQTEKLILAMYIEQYGVHSKEYKAQLHKYCEVDMLLDTRSGHWEKPFCVSK